MELALPDKGNYVGVYATCGQEPNEARHAVMQGKGQLLRVFKIHGWQYPKRSTRNR